MNSMSFSFWSGSRSSVKRTRRKVFHRARRAAIEEATPTFSSKVKRRSRTAVAVSMAANGSVLANASQSEPRCKASCGAPAILLCRDEYKSKFEQAWQGATVCGGESHSACLAADALWTVYDLWI